MNTNFVTFNLPNGDPFSLDLNTLQVLNVNDNLRDRIYAIVKNFPNQVLLWDGSTEYQQAGNWTNDSVIARLTNMLKTNNVRLLNYFYFPPDEPVENLDSTTPVVSAVS